MIAANCQAVPRLAALASNKANETKADASLRFQLHSYIVDAWMPNSCTLGENRDTQAHVIIGIL